MSSKVEYIFGIDLGTSNSGIAYWKDGKLTVIPDEYGNRTIPSYVAYTPLSKYVGVDARNQAEINTNNVFYDTKRLIGRKKNSLGAEAQLLSYVIKGDDNDNIILECSARQCNYTPEEIAGSILSKLKSMAKEYTNAEVNNVVITVPARFTDIQRSATRDAARIAGLNCLRIINEPTAASMAYGLANRSQDTTVRVLVYDFGGGTLDVSLVEISDGIFTTLCSAGNINLGGRDFDNRLMSYCIDRFKRKNKLTACLISNLSMQKITLACENAKKLLSINNKAVIAVRDFYAGIDLMEVIPRTKFETICQDLLLLSLKPIDDVLTECTLDVTDIDEIVLVGGMTKVPIIRNLIERRMKKTPNCTLDPNEAVVAGAAIQGSILLRDDDPFTDSLVLLDITTLSLGIETVGEVMDVIIKKNTTLPHRVSKLYTTSEDDMESVTIKIYEGERSMTKFNIFIGEFELTGIPKAPRGSVEIKITISVDLNGMITVEAEETTCHEKNHIIVKSNRDRFTHDEIERMISDAREQEYNDEIARTKRLMYLKVKDMCDIILRNCQTAKFSVADKQAIEADINDILVWLKKFDYNTVDNNKLEDIMTKLNKKYGMLVLRIDENNNKFKEGAVKTEGTNIYDDEKEHEEEEYANPEDIIKIIEFNESGAQNESEYNEINEAKQSLKNLCYTILDIISCSHVILDPVHKDELKGIIDDTLLWINIQSKPRVIDYEVKIKEINKICDEILSSYQDTTIFKKADAIHELENLCYTLIAMMNDRIIDDNNTYGQTLRDLIDESLDMKEITPLVAQERICLINKACDDIYNNVPRLELKTKIIDDNTQGMSILDIIRDRQSRDMELLDLTQ